MVLDRDSFGRLYEDTFETIFRYACVLTDDEGRAEDLAVDVYHQAWQQRPVLERVSAPLAWLLTKTYACARPAGEQSGTRRRPSADRQRGVGAAALLHRAVRELPAEQQQVILLRLIQRRSTADVADQLGRSASTIRAIQYDALCNLRNRLDLLDLRDALRSHPWDHESRRSRRARMGRIARTRGIFPPLQST